MSLQLRLWLSAMLLMFGVFVAYTGWRLYAAGRMQTSTANDLHRRAEALDKIVLTDTSNEPFKLDSMQGKVWVASFFFSACPGPCAQMNRAIAGLQKELKDDDVEFVSITVDPVNDTPEHLAEYARTFQADLKRWHFLSAPFATVQQLGVDVFQVPVGPKMHTERVILLDRASNVRGMYITSDAAQMLAMRRKIAKLLAETPAEAQAATKHSAAVEGSGDATAHDDAQPRTEPPHAEITIEGATRIDPAETSDAPTAKQASDEPKESD